MVLTSVETQVVCDGKLVGEGQRIKTFTVP